ncbi:major capsid protein [Tumebacillus sp. ITR2]|uniref:Major capsid protein n=1 Tax=Tumebacillus amylolyticus TaxID=2801339 RepID=A0ABS1JCD0_9BACL|nr:major capsid protein [Tumebacillus amylolyticus]MBL0387918.1 major capsid protein [Tumebacillus amylolyticus]
MSMSAAVTLSFPTTADVTHVVRNTATNPSKYRGMEILPDQGEFVNEIQVDVINAVQGIAGPRRLGGQFNQAKLTSNTVRKYATAYWGDTYTIDEDELLNARMEGTFNQRAGYNRVIRRANELNIRLNSLKEALRWDSLVKGVIKAENKNVKFEVVYDIPEKNYLDIDFTDPKLDIIDVIDTIQGIFDGSGAEGKKFWMNRGVASDLAKNTVLRDLLKRSNDAASLTAANIPTILNKMFPQLDFEVYTQGYENEAGIFVPFIPHDSFIVLAEGDEKFGDFCSTLAVQNGGLESPQPGKFSLIEDKTAEKVPYIDVTVGENGLPRFHHPRWLVRGKAKTTASLIQNSNNPSADAT